MIGVRKSHTSEILDPHLLVNCNINSNTPISSTIKRKEQRVTRLLPAGRYCFQERHGVRLYVCASARLRKMSALLIIFLAL